MLSPESKYRFRLSNTGREHHWYYFVWEGLKRVWKCVAFLYSFMLKVFYSSSSYMSTHKHSTSHLQSVVLSHAHWAAICFSFQVNRNKSSILFIFRQYSRSWIYYQLFKYKFQQMFAYISCMKYFYFYSVIFSKVRLFTENSGYSVLINTQFCQKHLRAPIFLHLISNKHCLWLHQSDEKWYYRPSQRCEFCTEI